MALRENGSATTNASAGSDTTHTHSLGVSPDFVILTPKSNGVVYLMSKSAGNFVVRGSAASLNFDYQVVVDHSIIK